MLIAACFTKSSKTKLFPPDIPYRDRGTSGERMMGGSLVTRNLSFIFVLVESREYVQKVTVKIFMFIC
jgi:hypothetical protein